MDIAKCRSFQPPIDDHQRYASYLWVKAVQGYFVLRQWFIEGHPCEWRVIRELEVTEEELHFFDEHGDLLEAELTS